MEEITKQELIDFEEEISQLFLDKKIRCPIHLSGNNEDELINIFKNIKKNDWVFSTHRNHYHALLKGIPKDYVMESIISGNSMHINSKKHKFFTSAIVGGILPIALGVSMAIKKNKENAMVWVFVGDMAAEMGIFHECTKYAGRNYLPIIFVIENNHYSVETLTQKSWGSAKNMPNIIKYDYDRKYPHVGVGKWVTF